MKDFIDPFIAMWYRQVKRFLRAKPRVVATFMQPIFWLLFFGLGFAAAFRTGGAVGPFMGLDYLAFLLPGVALMTVFVSSFMSGISVIWDKEFGYLKVVLVAPSSRKASILGRSMGDATIALIQGLIILIIGYPLVPSMNMGNIHLFILVSLLVSISFASIGIIIATKMKTIEGFQLIVNLITTPLLFLSGIFYPIDVAPDWLKPVILANPLTYGVDAVRLLMVGKGTFAFTTDLICLAVLSVVFLLIAVYQFEKATID